MLSLYISLPFCQHKCSYCDLNAYAGLNELIPAYVSALAKEIQTMGRVTDSPVHTVYFGGGTPSITPRLLLHDLFASVRKSFRLTPDVEISFEANPDALNESYLSDLKLLGVNRLSIGAQSAQPQELALFQRTHTFVDVQQAVRMARQAGIENVSLDLIYAIPGQTLLSWQDSLAKALELAPDHFSIYALSYDFETPMRAWIRRGLLAEPDGDLAAEMYGWVDETLAAAGYHQYELSTWAKGPEGGTPSAECRHNLQYWHNQSYLGMGAGAHGYWGGRRYANIASPTAYITRMNRAPGPVSTNLSRAVQSSHEVDRMVEMNETMLTGLRLNQGLADIDFRARFGVGILEVFAQEIGQLSVRGLVYWDGERLKLTKPARFVSNWVFELFV